MTVTDRDVCSRTTVLSLWETGNRLDSGTVDEADIVFFRPPVDGPLTCRVRAGYDADSGRIDRTVGYFDPIGRPVAEVFLSGPAGGRGDFAPIADELMRVVADRFDHDDVRRVRMRICDNDPDAPVEWSVEMLQRYRTDHETVEDLAIVGTAPCGAVEARAWVTVAAGS